MVNTLLIVISVISLVLWFLQEKLARPQIYANLDGCIANDSSLAADYAGFTVSVDVACDDSIGVNTDGAKLVTVTITDPIGNDSVFSVYKGNY